MPPCPGAENIGTGSVKCGVDMFALWKRVPILIEFEGRLGSIYFSLPARNSLDTRRTFMRQVTVLNYCCYKYNNWKIIFIN